MSYSITDIEDISVTDLQFQLDNVTSKSFNTMIVSTRGDSSSLRTFTFDIGRDRFIREQTTLFSAYRILSMNPTKPYTPLHSMINILSNHEVATTVAGSVVDRGDGSAYVVTTGLSINDPLESTNKVALTVDKPTVALRAGGVLNTDEYGSYKGQIDEHGVFKGHDNIRSRLL